MFGKICSATEWAVLIYLSPAVILFYLMQLIACLAVGLTIWHHMQYWCCTGAEDVDTGINPGTAETMKCDPFGVTDYCV